MITPERYDRLCRLFAKTYELPAEKRHALLEGECADDPSLSTEVEALIAQHQEAAAHPESALLDERSLQSLALGAVDDLSGQRIGSFRLERAIGSGGMGTVYEAVQDNPHRRVALKIIRPGFASANALRRFEYEAQILARLRHPGIAQIYEAGIHHDGTELPYFAMEYVPDARPLTEYAAITNATVVQRLELFARVCDAVHHGHQKGVIHRDLKPSNIVVDANGDPKVIDFGVARSIDSDVAATTLQTNVGQLIGTLQYMSPEQCAGDPNDLDIRSDVYALGVVLYELLCEQLPYNLTSQSIPDAIRQVREVAPTRPSTFNRSLRGDVDTIVTKAMAKERDRRYQSAAELADDIRRYLSHEPIVAHPPSTLYRFQKFARRHRAFVGAAAVTVIVLVGASVVSTTLYFKAEQARRTMDEQRSRATDAEARASAVNEFLIEDLLRAADPARSPNPDITMREVLDAAAQRLEGRFEQQPTVEAAVRDALVKTYRGLGLAEKALPHAERALELHRTTGEDRRDTIVAMGHLGQILQDLGRYDEAQPLYAEALQTSQRLYGDDTATASAMNDLGVLEEKLSHLPEAESYFTAAFDLCRRIGAEDDDVALNAMSNLAAIYRIRGKYDQAEALTLESLDRYRQRFGEDDPNTLQIMSHLARLQLDMGKFDESEQTYQDTLARRRRVLGDDHPQAVTTGNDLGVLYMHMGRWNDAEPLIRKSLQRHEQLLGEDHPDTLMSMSNLAALLGQVGRYDEAEPLHVRTLAVRREKLGPKHIATLMSMSNLAMFYLELERFEDAEPLFLETVATRTEVEGKYHPNTLGAMKNLSELYIRTKRYEEAEPLLLEVYTNLSEQFGMAHQHTRATVRSLVKLYDAWDMPDEAAVWRAKLPHEVNSNGQDD